MDLKEAFVTLEIEYGSSFAEARTAYRRLCIVWHPDRFQDGELKAHAEEKLKRINEAYSTIKNAAATDGSTVDADPGPVYEDLACRYMGGDVRLGKFAKNELRPHCAVQIAMDGLTMVTFRDGQVDESATYGLDTFVRLSVPGRENQAGNTQRDDWIRLADISRLFARPPSFFNENSIEIVVRDPEGILDHAMTITITFRNGYYAKLFGKRMREAWGLVKPKPKPKPKPAPKPKPKPEENIARRLWNCPFCGRTYRIPANVVDPGCCPQCRSDRSSGRHISDRWPSVAVVVVSALACCSVCLTLICFGVTGTTLTVALGHVLAPLVFGWYAYSTHGKKTVNRCVRFTRTAYARVIESHQRRVDERRKAEIERKRRAAEERRRRADAQRRRQEVAANAQRRRDEEIANAVRPVQIEWHAVQGVNTNGVKTYGIGDEHVYCYSFPTKLKLASIQQQSCCSIKVGMASGHPIDRIRDQVSASKTAMSEPAQVLLVFRTSDCRNLERWLHKQLDRDPTALGREWFLTSPSQLVERFQTYVRQTFVSSPHAIELRERDFH